VRDGGSDSGISHDERARADQGLNSAGRGAQTSVNAGSTEAKLRELMASYFNEDDLSTIEELFEEARRRVPMPEAPGAVTNSALVGPIEVPIPRASERPYRSVEVRCLEVT
jgi:hypothetical protein